MNTTLASVRFGNIYHLKGKIADQYTVSSGPANQTFIGKERQWLQNGLIIGLLLGRGFFDSDVFEAIQRGEHVEYSFLRTSSNGKSPKGYLIATGADYFVVNEADDVATNGTARRANSLANAAIEAAQAHGRYFEITA